MDLSNIPFEKLTIEDLHETAREMHAALGDPPKSRCGTRTPCAGCCHMNVKVFRREAELLVEHLPSDKGIEYLKRVTTRDDEDRLSQKRPCVFLKDDKCSVYDKRPLLCRSYHVVSEPRHCYDFKNKLSKVVHRQSLGIYSLLGHWWKAHPDQKPKLMEEHLLDILIGQEDGEGRDPVAEVHNEGRKE